MFPHVPDPGAPCTRPWNTLYQTLAHLVPDPGTPCTRPWHTLYQTLPVHRVPDPGTPCTRPWHTLYQTLEHLVPDPASTPRAGGRAKPGPMRVCTKIRLQNTNFLSIVILLSLFICLCSLFWQVVR